MERETAMKILKELHSKSLFAERTALETLIPELTESNAEKIRKTLVDALNKNLGNGIEKYGTTLNAALTWLEKQGKSSDQIHYWTEEEIEPIISDYLRGVEHYGGMIGRLRCLKPKSLEKQNDCSVKWQKNTPNYKPAINHSVLMKTTQGIAEGEWQGEDWFQYRWSWTLKDSDVLAWMELSNLDEQGEQKPAVVDFNAKDWYVSKVDGKIHDMTYNPADKVEPKFKVKYAGSEYNVLEVKDIAGVTFYGIEDEPNHIDYVKAENCEIISGYAIKENGSPYPTKSAVFSEKKLTAWNEEDDAYKEFAICAVEDYYDEENPLHKCIVNWLKSLKDRVQPQPKQEWSEEDENMANDLIEGCLSSEKIHHLAHTSKEIADWFKLLKERMTWKPSEKQMNAFEQVYEWYNNNFAPSETLTSLYNDLKKL